MKLVYTETNEPVNVGDRVCGLGAPMEVTYFREPHKPSSEGKVSLSNGREYYVSAIGAKWIDREDR